MRRNFFLALSGVLLTIVALAYTLFAAVSPVQGSAPATPKATRDPIKQATRRATRGLPTPESPTTVPTEIPSATPQPIVKKTKNKRVVVVSPVDPGPMSSTILVFNPDTTGSATVQIDVYNTAGIVAYTTTTTVSANGAKLVTLPSSLGTNFQGGAQVSSDKNVQAIVLGANSTNKARDAYEGILSPAQDVILPLVRHLAPNTQNTLIAIQNTTEISGSLTLRLYDISGTNTLTQTTTIAGHQSQYFNTNSLFAGNIFVGSARIVSDQNIAVAAQTLYYLDTAAFDGVPTNSAASDLYVNNVERKITGNVPINWSEIFVRNNGTNPASIKMDFYAVTGGAPVTSLTIPDVAPNGLAQFLLNDPSYSALGSNFGGWGHISSDTSEPLTATALQVLNKGKRLDAVNALANVDMGTRYVCGDAVRMSTENSQIALLNTDATNKAVVVVRLYDQNTGAKTAQGKFKVPPQSRLTVLLSDTKFAAAGTNYQGMALVQVNGTPRPNIAVTVSNPYANPKPSGISGYTCSKLQ